MLKWVSLENNVIDTGISCMSDHCKFLDVNSLSLRNP